MVNIAVLRLDMHHLQNVTASSGSIRNMDAEAHAANKLDKSTSDSYSRYQNVSV